MIDLSDEPGHPPLGSRDFQFTVGVYQDSLASWAIVGRDESASEDDDWPPPHVVRDAITGRPAIYERGQQRVATEDEVRGLEPAAVWDASHVIARIETT